MNTHKNENGIALIIVIAIMVALVMSAAALLSIVTQQSDTAKAYKQDDLVLLGILSAKAKIINEIETIGGSTRPFPTKPYLDRAQTDKRYITSPYYYDGDERNNPLLVFRYPLRSGNVNETAQSVLNRQQQELKLLNLDDEQLLTVASFNKDLSASSDFYSLKYDYRVIILDKTSATLAAGGGYNTGVSLTSNNNVIDFDSPIYQEMAACEPTKNFVNSYLNWYYGAHHGYGGYALPKIFTFDAATPEYDITKVFAKMQSNRFIDIYPESREIELVTGEKINAERIAGIFDIVGREGELGVKRRFLSFSEVAAQVLIDQEKGKKWNPPQTLMGVSLLFNPLNPLRRMPSSNSPNYRIDSFILNARTPTWLIAAMVNTHKNGPHKGVSLDLPAAVTIINNGKSGTDVAPLISQLLTTWGYKPNITDKNSADGKKNAAIEWMLYSMFEVNKVIAEINKIKGSGLDVFFQDTVPTATQLTATGRLVTDNTSIAKLRTRNFRVWLYVALVNNATQEHVAWARVDFVYDGSFSKAVIYNRFFDEVE